MLGGQSNEPPYYANDEESPAVRGEDVFRHVPLACITRKEKPAGEGGLKVSKGVRQLCTSVRERFVKGGADALPKHLTCFPELTWPDTQDAMAAWIVVRGSRARKKAETLRLERTCAINQS